MEFTEAESNMNDLVSSFSFFIRILYFTFMYSTALCYLGCLKTRWASTSSTRTLLQRTSSLTKTRSVVDESWKTIKCFHITNHCHVWQSKRRKILKVIFFGGNFYHPWFRARRGWTDLKRTDYHLTDLPRTTSLLFRQIKISFFSKCSCSSINQKIFSSLESLVWEKMQMHAYCTLHLEYCILHICTMQDRETDAPMQSIMRWQRRRASLRFYLFSWYCRAKEHLLCLQISFKWRERCFDSIFYSVMASCCISSTADFLWNIEIWKIILIALEALEDLWNVKIGKMKPTVSHRY